MVESLETLEDNAFMLAETITEVNRDIYVCGVKLELAREYNKLDQVVALQEKQIELLQRQRDLLFDFLDIMVRLSEHGRSSRRLLDIYAELLRKMRDPNNVSLFAAEEEEQ
jgi:hypothetical protein